MSGHGWAIMGIGAGVALLPAAFHAADALRQWVRNRRADRALLEAEARLAERTAMLEREIDLRLSAERAAADLRAKLRAFGTRGND